MRETITLTVSLPPAMAKQVERAMKAEHRTRSELVREALRVYFSARLSPTERLTSAQERLYRDGGPATLVGKTNGSGQQQSNKRKSRKLKGFFQAMAAHSRRIPSLPDVAFTRESFYRDHD